MTVGIAAIAENDGDPCAVVAADRMVTVGRGGGVEYEDTSSKIEVFLHSDTACAVAIGAGKTVYINEMLRVLNELVAGNFHNISTVQNAAELAKRAYQKVVQNTVEEQVLSPLDYSLDDLKDNEVTVPLELQRKFAEEAEKLRNSFSNEVHLVVSGVGKTGPEVFMISGSKLTNHTDQGYKVIGTGSGSGRLSFIRQRYDPGCSMQEAMFTVAEAKSQSEERQGVGRKMDVSLIRQDSIKQLDESAKEELRKAISRVETAEGDERQRVMDSWTLP